MTAPVFPSVDPADIYDLIGIGLGPTHVALAVAFKEDHPDGRALFLDQRPAFAWHPALLLPASRMQISFLKDLATFRNPQSTFSFVSYLHACGRLVAFTNLGVWTPSRLEWASYLAWAAERLESDGYVEWDARVEAIEPVPSATNDGGSGVVRLFKVTRRDPGTNTVRTSYARNVSVAPGSTPYIPAPFASLTTPRIAHTATYLTTLASPALAHQLDPATFSGRVAVIGGGQSSAEVFNDLMGRLPNAKVDMIYRASALVPADDSPFVNARAFDPAMTDEFWSMREGERQERLREFRRANYACVAPELIESMYKLTYTQSVRGGTPQYRLLSNTEVTNIELVSTTSSTGLNTSASSEDRSSIRLSLGPTLSTGSAPSVETYDLVFLGTGYHRPAASLAFLSQTKDAFPALGHFISGESTILQVGRDYAIAPASGAEASAKLFVLGFAEKTHGLSETLLSVGAVRAGEVVRALAPPLPQHKEKVVAGAKTTGEPKVPMLDVPRGRLVQHTGTLTPESDGSPERKSFT